MLKTTPNMLELDSPISRWGERERLKYSYFKSFFRLHGIVSPHFSTPPSTLVNKAIGLIRHMACLVG